MRLRRKTDHQIGFLVTEEGEKRVRLDRGTTKMSDTSTFPYREQEWEPAPRVPLQPSQIARVLYDFDRAYQIVRGNYGVPEWNSLRDEAKRAAIEPPRTDDPARIRWHAWLRKELEKA